MATIKHWHLLIISLVVTSGCSALIPVPKTTQPPVVNGNITKPSNQAQVPVPTPTVSTLPAQSVPNLQLARESFDQGMHYRRSGQYQKAIAAFDLAIENDPNHVEAWINRASPLSILNRYSEALASLDQAVKLNPNFFQVWNNRGIALAKLNRYEEAIASFDKALQINSLYDKAWINRGDALAKLQRYDEAVTSFDKALQIDPNDAIALSNRARVLEDLGQTNTALALRNS